ncbi:hypothetical protein COU54_01865 [Candidatus Pacearchaeota archaeon CG10_big_fil_rev_8_21_14_0_10_31_24]|nr:MAG: hypothetical protein COU54_01865 [Candidatus Pacearchaeota archaeon CG10_big_fil_rev_8_21_14_0_10_31_24]
MNKKGLSPVIATVLLISIALVLSAIFFFWVKGFLGEQNQKRGEPIENSCEAISFEVEAISEQGKSTIDIVNTGNIALFGIEVELRNEAKGKIENLGRFGVADLNLDFEGGELSEVDIGNMILKGETRSVTVHPYETNPLARQLKEDEQLIVVPIILGEKKTERIDYTCSEKYGVETVVRAL